MKNTRCTDFCVPKNSSIKQLLKTMRVTIFLLFFCVFSTIAGTVLSLIHILKSSPTVRSAKCMAR